MTLLFTLFAFTLIVALSSFFVLKRRVGLLYASALCSIGLIFAFTTISLLYKSNVTKMIYRGLNVMKPKVAIQKYLKPKIEETYSYNGISISVLARVNSNPSSERSVTAEFNDDVKLYALINDNGNYYTDAPDWLKAKKAKSLKNHPHSTRLKWYKIEPEYKYYIHKNEYKRFNLAFCNQMKMGEMKFFQKYLSGKSHIPLSQKSYTNRTLYWDKKPVGTMRYKVVAIIDGNEISSKGVEYLNSGDFQKMNKVMRVSVRADSGNKVLDQAFAYGNLPYYWGSNNFNYAWYGSDCAKYTSVVYKETGQSIGYIGTAQLNGRKARAIINGKNAKNQPTSKGKVLRFNNNVSIGDIIVMRNNRRGHAGFIGEDSNENGILDGEDMVLHTSFSAPKYEKLKDTHFILDRVIRDYDVKIIKE